MTYRVVVPVDTNESRASHQARYVDRLATADTTIEATVLHVVRETESDTAFSSVDAAVAAADDLEAAGIEVTRAIEAGPRSAVIVRMADELDANEIVTGGRKRSGVAKVLLGSTVTDVLLSADRPVTITGKRVELGEGPLHALVPVDHDRDRARQQVEYVSALPGGPDGVGVTVLHVFEHLDYAGAPHHEFDEIDAAVETAGALEDRGFAVDRVAIGGEIARTILEAADSRDVDTIVMAGRKRSGLQRVILGSTSHDVILSAHRPVTLTG
ncbi:MAG: universal stress protein [Halobacteriota archaeon]